MYKKKNIVAVIPARGGSKGVLHKNIKLLGRKPLISYVIRAALASKYINKVVVSTDDKEIAEIAKKYKAEVPFIRPSRLAQDNSTSLSVLKHAVKYLEKKNIFNSDLVVLLQPTSPFVLPGDIDKAINKIQKTNTNSCVSVCEISERPEWMYIFEGPNRIKPYLKKKEKTTNRQMLSEIFRLNGAIYVVKRDVLMKKNKIIDKGNTSAIVMPLERSVDIDRPIDFSIAETILKKGLGNFSSAKKNHKNG